MTDKAEITPLTPKELAELERLLEVEVEPYGGVSIEYLDGLIAGVRCCPAPVNADLWLPIVFGLGDRETVGDRLELQPELAPVLPLIQRHHDAVVQLLWTGGYAPVLRDSPSNGPPKGPPGRAWARSFLTALHNFGGAKWRKLLNVPEYEGLLSVAVDLAYDGEPGPDGKIKRLPKRRRADLVKALEIVVPALARSATLTPARFRKIANKPAPAPADAGAKPARARSTKARSKSD